MSTGKKVRIGGVEVDAVALNKFLNTAIKKAIEQKTFVKDSSTCALPCKLFSQKRIKRLYKVHSSVAKVADIMGCSKQMVYLALRK